MKIGIVAASLLVCALCLGPAQASATAHGAGKTRLEDLDQLPARAYPLSCSVEELTRSAADLHALAEELRRNQMEVLERFEFGSLAVEREFRSRLLQVDMALGNWDEALDDIQAMRRLSEDEALNHMSAIHAEAWVKARISAGDEASADAAREAYGRILEEAVNALPWAVVRQELAKKQARLKMATEDMVRAMLARLEPQPESEGLLDEASAHTVVSMCNALEILVPLKDLTADIYAAFLERGQAGRSPLMTERRRALTREDGGEPVLVAIWDTGLDVEVFSGQVHVNPAERPDGRDTDGNGHVDDLHGIAFDEDLMPTRGLLMPHDFPSEVLGEIRQALQGIEDLETGHETPEATQLQDLLSTLDKEDKREFRKGTEFYDLYVHGTHVAGIAVEGNPYARILPIRVTLDDSAVKTREWTRAFAKMCRETVDYCKARGVRVVNMSWGWDVREIADNLAAHGADDDDRERADLAEEIFAILERGLYEALASAPDILFVNGAGDARGDREDYRWIPGVLDLPNLIPVGAVDAFGEPTSFSDHGSHVRLHADGFHVESVVPGGERMRLSGTSMAAPQVANLAAKLVALDPSLTPAEVIDLMLAGGEVVERAGRKRILLNPRRTIELLNEQAGG